MPIRHIEKYGDDGVSFGKMFYFSPIGYVGNIEDKDLTSPPSGGFGKAYIVGTGATGDWAGKDGQIAIDRRQGATAEWDFVVPTEGMLVYVRDEDKFYRHSGSAWESTIRAVNLEMSDAAATWRSLRFRTNEALRWVIAADSAAESGSDAGSDLQIRRYNDAGVYLSSPVIIRRATGVIELYHNVNVKENIQMASGKTVDGVDVSDHRARHRGDGADPIDNATISVAGLMSSTDKQKVDRIIENSFDYTFSDDVVMTNANAWYDLASISINVKTGFNQLIFGSFQVTTNADGHRVDVRAKCVSATLGTFYLPTRSLGTGNIREFNMQYFVNWYCNTLSFNETVTFTLQGQCTLAGRTATDIRFTVLRL
ncbi:MAG: DUF2793 domain-containing protein [Planctomycetota bacterium]|nr:DUF2793 domain-containing protein [Planctomycetota bacterium]